MSADPEVARARERARVYSTKHRGLSYRLKNDGTRTYLGYVRGRGRVRLAATEYQVAREEYAELVGAVAKGKKIAPSSLRFKDVAEQWLDGKNNRLKEWTRRGYRASLDNEILPVFGPRKLREISVDDVARFIRKLEAKGLASSTIDSHLKPLSGTFKYAVRRGMISASPVSALTRDDRPVRAQSKKAYEWTTEEIQSLFLAAVLRAKEPESRADYTLLFRVAVYAGLRLGELLGLQWQDVDLEEGTINVQRQFDKTGQVSPPKTKAAIRRVPIRPELVKALREHKMASPFSKDEDFVFASKTGGPKLHRTVQRAFESIRDKANLPEILTFHDLRHAFASVAVHAGADPLFLATVLGHADVTITMRVYTHLFDRPQREASFRKAMGDAAW